MKRFLSLLLASTLVIGALTACNRNKPEPEKTPEPQPDKPVFVYQDGTYTAQYDVPALDRTLDYLTVTIKEDVIQIEDYGMREAEDPSAAGSASDASAASSTAASSSEAQSSSDASSSAELSEHEAAALAAAELIVEEYDRVKGNVDEMRVIKDAEEHTYRFMRMMRSILTAAKDGKTAPIQLGKYADGTYRSVMPDANADGWKEYVELTVSGGTISSITFDAMKGDDATALITADAELNKQTNKPSEYYPQIAKNFGEAGDDLTKMLSPSGGGEATKSFGKLMRPLLINLISGGEKEIVASRYMNGTYKAQFKDFDANGWKEYVVVEIQNGVVTIVDFDAISKADEKKRRADDEDVETKMKEKTGLRFSDAADALIASWGKSNNDVTLVENVSGATVASNGFKLLVGQILATAAIEGDNQKTLEVERLVVK